MITKNLNVEQMLQYMQKYAAVYDFLNHKK